MMDMIMADTLMMSQWASMAGSAVRRVSGASKEQKWSGLGWHGCGERIYASARGG